MAIVFKRNERAAPVPQPVVSPPTVQPTLDMLGLGDTPKDSFGPTAKETREKIDPDRFKILFQVGDRVKIDTLYYWVKTYGTGDTGTVTKVVGIPRATMAIARDCMYRVLLDTPRVPETPEVVITQLELRKPR